MGMFMKFWVDLNLNLVPLGILKGEYPNVPPLKFKIATQKWRHLICKGKYIFQTIICGIYSSNFEICFVN